MLKPDVCAVYVATSVDFILEQCGEQGLIDFLCDVLGVPDEARKDIPECDILKKGLTPCVRKNNQALSVYVVCKVLQLVKEGLKPSDAIRFTWAEVLGDDDAGVG